MNVSRLATLGLAAMVSPAQTQPPLTLEAAVRQSAEKYPSVRVSMEQVGAAAAQINVARTAYLPRVDFLGQINRATKNNIYGMLLQQNVISPISGPPVTENSGTSVFGSAAGFLVSWEPFDFGLRKAQVGAAESARRRAGTSVERTKFEVSAAAADLFLTVLAAEQSVKAAEAGIVRAQLLHETVSALAQSGLRPGSDEARARTELIMSETQRIQAQQAVAVSRATLANLLAIPESALRLEPARLIEAPPESSAPAASATHPSLKEQVAAIDEVRAQRGILDRSFYPKFALQGTTYARGTGANPDFTVQGGANGLAPTYYNWGLGFTMTVPLMDYKIIREKKQVEVQRERVESARLDQIRTEIDGRLARARATLESAWQIARTVPAQLEATQAARDQAAARYKAGLASIVEIADAQRLLTQAEIDNSLARLGVWRAMLAVSAASGDLEPFLASARRP